MIAFLRKLWARTHQWWLDLLKAHLTPLEVGWAVGVGILIGCLPVYGLHFAACALVCRWFGWNIGVMYAAANISNPFFAPALVAAELTLGDWIRYGNSTDTKPFELSLWVLVQEAPDRLLSITVGSVVIGGVLGAVFGFAAWGWMRWRKPKDLV